MKIKKIRIYRLSFSSYDSVNSLSTCGKRLTENSNYRFRCESFPIYTLRNDELSQYLLGVNVRLYHYLNCFCHLLILISFNMFFEIYLLWTKACNPFLSSFFQLKNFFDRRKIFSNNICIIENGIIFASDKCNMSNN